MTDKKAKNLKRIEKWLAKIDYTIRHHGNGFWFIYDHHGSCTDWCIRGDVDTRIHIEPSNATRWYCQFSLKDATPYALRDSKKQFDCVGFKAKKNGDVFVQFYNHGRSRALPDNK